MFNTYDPNIDLIILTHVEKLLFTSDISNISFNFASSYLSENLDDLQYAFLFFVNVTIYDDLRKKDVWRVDILLIIM